MFFIIVEWLIIRAIALFSFIEDRVAVRGDDLIITVRVDEFFELDVLIIRLRVHGWDFFIRVRFLSIEESDVLWL